VIVKTARPSVPAGLFFGELNEKGLQGTLMTIKQTLGLLVLVAVCFIAFGCGENDGKSEFEGTITWNGEPIKSGNIELHPDGGEGQIDGAEIKDGKFTIRTTSGEKLVKVLASREVGKTKGDDRVPPEPIMHQYLPFEFNAKSTLKTTVNEASSIELKLTGEDLAEGTKPPETRTKRHRH